MACQGCGRTSQTRLCCPTCIEYGRTSFFCGQECFTKNWAAHNQLHDLLKKNAALAAPDVEGGAAAPRTGGPTGRAPLPGGASLVSSAQKRANAYGGSGGAVSSSAPRLAANAAAGPAPAGVLGDLFSMVSAALGGGAGDASRSTDLKDHKPSARQPANARSRSPAAGDSKPAPPPKPRVPLLQRGLWALLAVALIAGGLFYREFLRYSEGERQSQEAVLVRVEKAAEQVVPGLAAAVDNLVTAPTPDVDTTTTVEPAMQVAALKAELSSLRELVDRHDKMLRYVMDRYQEKAGQALAAADVPQGGRATEAHTASAVNFSAPEFVSRSVNDDDVQKPGDLLRKRKGGGDVMDLPVGLPTLEGGGGAAAAS